MGLTLVFAIACLAFGANAKGISTKLAQKPVCDGQQLACTYCLDTVDFLQGTTDDSVVEDAIVKFMLVICDFMNSTSPAQKECVNYIKAFPARAKTATNSIFANPKELCSFVCKSRGPVSDNCQLKPSAKVDCPAVKTDDSIACEVCKSVPTIVKEIMGGKGFLDLLEKFLLMNCDLIAPGCEKDICVDHTKFLAVKIKFFTEMFLNPEIGCGFICAW